MSRNLTQDELGKLLKVKRSTVAMWEAGKSSPTAAKIPILAKVLGCKLEDLY